MQSYWVSTPRWTCLVIVSPQGVIMHTAAYLWRARGRSWTTMVQQWQADYGASLHIVQMP